MNSNSIRCPNCQKEIPLNEAVSHQIREQLAREFEIKAAEREKTFADREKEMLQQRKALEKSQANLAEEIERKVREEKTKLKAEAAKEAQAQLSVEMQDLKSKLAERESKIAESQKAELALRKKQRDLEEKQAALELEIARKLDEERGKIREDAKRQAAEEQHFKMCEKDKQLGDLQKQIEILKQKAEQGSQQSQGEVLELEFESLLREKFPHDEIAPVSTGARGADVLQKVRTATGIECGTIIWETKRTRNWSNAWVAKLKDDQRANRADIAVLLTTALPDCVKNFSAHEGIWVTDFACGLGLAGALRQGLINLGNAHRAESGKKEKMEVLYNYLSGTEFRQKIEAIVESFVAMKTDLDSEKRALTKIWAKREKQLEQVLHNTSLMYGDMQGIIGQAALPEIKILELGE